MENFIKHKESKLNFKSLNSTWGGLDGGSTASSGGSDMSNKGMMDNATGNGAFSVDAKSKVGLQVDKAVFRMADEKAI